MLPPNLQARVDRAVDNFMQGYGCCQSVVAAFADLYGLDDTMAKRIGAGFGGGVGRMRMMCGAVSGIVVLVGLDCGQTEGSDREGKSACYKVVQELLAQSKAQNGSLICAEILGLKGNVKAQSSYEASARTAEYYKTRPCAAKVESAARIFAEYLLKVKRTFKGKSEKRKVKNPCACFSHSLGYWIFHSSLFTFKAKPFYLFTFK